MVILTSPHIIYLNVDLDLDTLGRLVYRTDIINIYVLIILTSRKCVYFTCTTSQTDVNFSASPNAHNLVIFLYSIKSHVTFTKFYRGRLPQRWPVGNVYPRFQLEVSLTKSLAAETRNQFQRTYLLSTNLPTFKANLKLLHSSDAGTPSKKLQIKRQDKLSFNFDY